MKKFSLALLGTIAMLAAAPAMAGGENGNNGNGNNCQGNSCGNGAGVGFVLGAGVLGASGSGTVAFTHAHGSQSGGGVSFGKTEVTADAASNFRLGTNVGFGANIAGATSSSSVSGSLVNGNGSASNVTFGGAVAGAGVAGVAGASFR